MYLSTKQMVTKAYILGALHDSTERKYTYRVSQKSLEYVELLKEGILALGSKAWVYQEGKSRDVYVVEFAKRLVDDITALSLQDKIDYTRGYFDTEGSIPRNSSARYYIYFAQKNLEDLLEVRNFLLEVGISCGKVHTPSRLVDPDYYRFYILSKSHDLFAKKIGSYHPVKSKYLRMKI